jgi:hypothetical protein
LGDRVESALLRVSWGRSLVSPSEVPAERDMNDAGLGELVSGDEGDPVVFDLVLVVRPCERR